MSRCVICCVALLLSLQRSTTALSDVSSCMTRAEALIVKAPDFSKVSVTTSHLYKRHLAQHFCKIGEDMTAVELGVFHGYTTSVLANMFKKVIAVDINKGLLEIAAENLGDLERNVVFIHMDLMSDDWSKFANNHVKVVVIDADHTYGGVRRDAESALHYLPELEWMVFHDTWMSQIEQAVLEFEEQGILKCENLGWGFDGSSYEYPELDERDEKVINVIIMHKPEGKLCRRLLKSEAQATQLHPSFLDRRFLLYRQPISQLQICAATAWRFLPSGRVRTEKWKSGHWKLLNESQASLSVRLPYLTTRLMEIHFNFARSAFLVTYAGELHAQWFGISENMVHRPFHVASALF